MNVFRYPPKSLVGDYVRSAVGLAVGLGVLASMPSSITVIAVFGAMTALFLVFSYRTLQRHLLQVAVTNEEICSSGLGTRVMPWDALDRLMLRYYGTRRQRSREMRGGFMQLTLKGAGETLTLESSIDGFEYIAWRAAKAARDNGVGVDATSAGNLLELGIDADTEQPAPKIRGPLDL